MPPRLPLILPLFFLLSVASVFAQTTSPLENLPASDLIKLLVETQFRSEEIEATMVLRRKYPNTTEEMVAKGFLESMEGRDEAAVKQYRKVLAQNPDYVPALLLLAGLLTTDESFGLYERAFQKDPAAHDYAAVKLAYDFLSRKVDSSAPQTDSHKTIAEFLVKWEQRAPDAYVFDYLRGREAARLGENEKAEGYYQKAIDKHAPDFQIYALIAALRFKTRQGNITDEELKHNFDPILEFAKRHPQSAQPYVFLGTRAFEVLDMPEKGYEIYSKLFPTKPTVDSALASFAKAFELKPVEEVAVLSYKGLMNLGRGHGHKEAIKFQPKAYENLLNISTKLPGSRLVFETLADHATTYMRDGALAASYWEKALENSQLVTDRTNIVLSLAQKVYGELSFDHEKAESIYKAELEKGGDRREILFGLYINSRNSQDFKAALKHLDEYENYIRTLPSDEAKRYSEIILDRRRQVNTLINNANQTAALYRDNEFLKTWQKSLGSVVLTINFPPNSAEIPIADYPKLARAATLLKDPNASRYMLTIQGHSDGNEVDRALSQQRADAIKRHLNELPGMDSVEIQSEGFGPDYPIASNQTPEGRAINRRVEILPLGSISKPTISATSAMNADGTIAVSPDGRFLAVGRDPIQLWDTRANIKVKDLGRGGRSLKFSPNGRYLATGMYYYEVGGFRTNALVVYDVKTGLPVSQIPWLGYITNFDWDPLSQKIVYSVAPNQIVIYDLATGRNMKQRASPGAKMSGGDLLLWTRDGKYIVAGRAAHTELQVYDAQSLALVKELPGVVWPHALAQTTDEMYLVCTSQSDGDARLLTVWNTSDWQMRQMEIPALANDISVHPEKHTVVLNDFGCGSSDDNAKKCLNASVLVDLDEMKVLDVVSVGAHDVQNGFSSEGRKLYQAFEDRVEVIDVSNNKLKPLTTIRGTSLRPDGSAADVVNGYFLTGGRNGIHVWNVTTGKKVHSWKQSAKLFGAFEGPAGLWAIAEDEVREQSKLWTFDTGTLAEKELLTLDLNVDRVFITPEVIAIAGKKFLPAHAAAEKGTIEIYSRTTLKLQTRFEVPLMRGRLSDRAYDSGFRTLTVNQNGTQVAYSTFWQDGFGHGLTLSKAACLYDVAAASEAGCLNMDEAVEELTYAKGNNSHLEITGRSKTFVVDTQTNKQIAEGNRRAGEKQIRLKNGAEVFWSENYIRYTPKAGDKIRELYFPGDLVGVSVFEAQNLLLTLNNANEISFYDLRRGSLELTILSKNDDEWIAYTPTGEFISSPRGTHKVFWSLGDRYLEFSALRENFERRDIIAQKLEAIAKLNVAGNRPEPNIGNSFAPTYQVEVISRTGIETKEGQYELVLRLESKDPNPPPPVLSFSHQSQRLTSEGTQVIQQPGTNVYTVKRVFDLADNENHIQIIQHQGAARLIEQEFTITKIPGPPAPATLWFLGLAVKSYKDPKDNLRFPVDDVTSIQAELAKQEGSIYKKVNPKTLKEKEVHIESIQGELYYMLQNAGPNDVLMIYISGHGLVNKYQNVVLMPAGSDLRDSTRGIDMVSFLGFFAKKKPGQKIVIFLDICHAGALGNDPRFKKSLITNVDIDGATNSIGGAAVFASATNGKAANEGQPPHYQNGYFAKAILEGLRGKSTPVLGQMRGQILIGELVRYVTDRVYEDTKGQQQPYPLRIDSISNDPFAVCPTKKQEGSN